MIGRPRQLPDGVDNGRIARAFFSVNAALMGSVALVFLLLASDISLGERLVFAGTFGAIAFIEARLAFGGVWVTPDGLRVRNPVRTSRIGWDEFEGFEMRRWLMYPDVGFVLRRKAKPVHMVSLSTLGVGGLVGDEFAVPDAIDHLEELSDRARNWEVHADD